MQQTQEQTQASEATGVQSTDTIRVSDANIEMSGDTSLGGLYDWLRGIFSSEQEGQSAQESTQESAQAVAGHIEMLTGTATVLRNDEEAPLRLGDGIFALDTLTTGADSNLTIIFSDGMEFRLGEEAKMLIDDFVFDQAASTGLQSLSVIKGAFSYHSGLLAANDPSAVSLNTPLGTLGIRGTKLMGLADTPVGECVITLLEGRVHVTGDRGGSAVLSEKFDTAKMKIEWEHVDKSQPSRSEAESTFKDLLFGGDEDAMRSFIDDDKSSLRLEDSNAYSIYGGSIYGDSSFDAGATEMATHIGG